MPGQTATGGEVFRIVRSPFYSRPQLALAPRYFSLLNAFADMGEGMVLGDGERVVAFHERHLRYVELHPELLSRASH